MDERQATPPRPHPTPGDLTPRQREIVVLIAEGLTNTEIARRLTITPGTAANHVEHVLRRLGVRSRVQAAMWGVAHGLVRVQLPPVSEEGGEGSASAAL